MPEYLDTLSPGQRIDRYELSGVLGAGAFGVTYLGFDRRHQISVAIKEYLPGEFAIRHEANVVPRSINEKADFNWGLNRFLKEARLLARLSHPNIINVHRCFQAHGTGYIVMEYAKGDTLAQLLKRRGVLTEKELKALLFPILDGLEHVHQIGYMHRDIKPGNIIIREDNSPVILDFGAARLALNTRSRSVTSLVTPGYAPIEQYSSRGNQGPWTDIYATGAVAYRALTGLPPEPAPERVYEDALKGWTARIPDATPEFLKAIDHALAFKEEERPQTIAEWRSALGPEATPSEGPRSPMVGTEEVEPPAPKHTPRHEGSVQPRRRPWREAYRTAARWLVKRGRLIADWSTRRLQLIAISALAVMAVSLALWLATKIEPIPVSTSGEVDAVDSPRRDKPRQNLDQERRATELITAIQVELRRLGYAEVTVDGLDGSQTKMALRDFKRRTDTGIEIGITQATLDALRSTASPLTIESIVTLHGHYDDVNSVAFSPDGRQVVTASSDTTARVWDAATGRQAIVLEGHQGSVNSVAISPNGTHIVTASNDNTARVWDLATGRQSVVLQGHEGRVNTVTISPDGAHVLSASDDRTARLWRIVDGQHVATFRGHRTYVNSAFFSPDGRQVATASLDKTIHVWDTVSRLRLAMFTGGSGVNLALYSPGGDSILAIYADHTVLFWGVGTGRHLTTLVGHTGKVRSAAFSPDGRRVATASFDNTMRLWEVPSGRHLTTLAAHDLWLSAVAFSPNGKRIATASGDNTARLWELSN